MSTSTWTIRRRKATLNTVPPEQDVVEILRDGCPVVLMGRWTTLCITGGPVNALQATDEQILDAYLNDESVLRVKARKP